MLFVCLFVCLIDYFICLFVCVCVADLRAAAVGGVVVSCGAADVGIAVASAGLTFVFVVLC